VSYFNATNGDDHTFPFQSRAAAADDYSEGLTKREHFAATALQGVLANGALMQSFSRADDAPGGNDDDAMEAYLAKFAARMAVASADALIKALNGESVPAQTSFVGFYDLPQDIQMSIQRMIDVLPKDSPDYKLLSGWTLPF
jgi:hypothetical protein